MKKFTHIIYLLALLSATCCCMTSCTEDLTKLPTVSTEFVSNVGSLTVNCGGNITADGGSVVTARGVCWGLKRNPTINDNKTTDGNGIGSYPSIVTGLNKATYYYVRAYAQNANGVNYGDNMIFLTGDINVPTLTTNVVTSVTSSSATSGGSVTSDGGDAVLQKGVCWSTTESPTIDNNTNTNNGTGLGSFMSSISGLAGGTTYYVRAYATNSAGTGYGNTVSFTTTITDVCGNIYTTIKIGTQTWMVENLKTTKYNDNTPISYVTDATTWKTTSNAAYCWPMNSISNKSYGALYNYYAVSTNKLAPTGFRVANDADWTTLINYLGGESVAGGELKDSGISYWASPNYYATNSSGFKAFGAGYRNINGIWDMFRSWGCWWSAGTASYHYRLSLDTNNGTANWAPDPSLTDGFSVRCIKN